MALQMTWHPRCHRGGAAPLGLKNLGNSCYLNSVLQCLTYTPPLAQFCLSSRHSSLCKSVFANREKECPFCILERQIARSLSMDGTLDAPSKVHKCVTLFAEHFQWGRQEDAHEFLRYVIDACHNACLKIHKRSGCGGGNGGGAGGDPAAEKLLGPSTVMKDIFGGSLLSQVKCLTCRGESNKTDEIMDICLDLYQSSSLKDALGRFFQPELLDGNNKYSCSNCKKLSVAKKQMFLERAPNVLVIQLKRFEGIHCAKINRNIEFDEGLELSKFMSSMNQDPEPEYSLFGSIVHSGFSPDSGHYYAYIKDSSGRWYCCNDAHVSLSSMQEVLSEKVYILFYIRNVMSPKPSKSISSCNGYKHSDTNGSNISSLKFAEIGKPSTIKANGALSMLKNGKPVPSPQIKPINLKSEEIKRTISNGIGNLNVQNKGSIAMGTISHGETKMVEKVKTPTTSNLNEANVKISSDMVEKNKKQALISQAANGCINPFCKNGNVKKDIEQGKVLEKCFSNDGSSKLENHEHHKVSTISSNYNTSENSVLGMTNPSGLLRENGPSKNHVVSGKRHFQEIEKFKELLAEEAISELRSCGWVDKVQSFMHARKRIRMQIPDAPPDKSLIRRELLSDAKKTFTSQIPESLKEHLVELLKSFSKRTPLLDFRVSK